jgi:PAS domain-containing protein
MLLTAPGYRILDANEAACRIFGRTREELCRVGGKGVVDITPDFDTFIVKAL